MANSRVEKLKAEGRLNRFKDCAKRVGVRGIGTGIIFFCCCFLCMMLQANRKLIYFGLLFFFVSSRFQFTPPPPSKWRVMTKKRL